MDLNSRTTYQFSRQFFLRGIAQFDSSRYRVLTDFLAPYELRPGTVAYAGYGSLIERQDFVSGDWVLGTGSYRTTQRGPLQGVVPASVLRYATCWRFR